MVDVAAQKAAVAKLWALGILTFKLDEAQKSLDRDVSKALEEARNRFVLLCSRRWGKTHYMVVKAIERAIQKPGTQIAFVSKTKRNAKEIAESIVKKIMVDCPAKLKPVYNRQDFRYNFKNGSSIFFLGCDGAHYDKIRGREFHLILVDEAGFIDDLQTIVDEVLRPTLLTTNGFMLFASTPPKKPSHPFTTIYRRAQSEGAFVLRTIYDNPRLKPFQIEREKEEQGGEHSEVWRREYLCEFLDSDTNAIVPEWTVERASRCVADVQRPAFCDRYVGLDLGFRDLTAAIFGWWDFPNARLVIEDELLLEGEETTTGALAIALKAKMLSLWGPESDWAGKGDLHQFCDVDPRLVHELRTAGLNFRQTSRESKETAINTVRMMVDHDQIYISPRCKVLIRTLYEGAWDKKHKEWVRAEGIGHCDLIDALAYTCRNIRRHANPHAPAYNWQDELLVRRPAPQSSAVKALGSCFGKDAGQSLRAQVNAKLGRRRF